MSVLEIAIGVALGKLIYEVMGALLALTLVSLSPPKPKGEDDDG